MTAIATLTCKNMLRQLLYLWFLLFRTLRRGLFGVAVKPNLYFVGDLRLASTVVFMKSIALNVQLLSRDYFQ